MSTLYYFEGSRDLNLEKTFSFLFKHVKVYIYK